MDARHRHRPVKWRLSSAYEFNTYNRAMERVHKTTGEKFERLVQIMATLRGPDGCPWDKEQDFNSLKPMLVEEVYEVLEAVENNDFDGIAEELGDLLLHVVFHAHLGKETGHFDINTVIDKISEKLILRHHHEFGNDTPGSDEEVIEY